MSADPSSGRRPDNIAAAIADVSDRASLLVREEIELAKAEVTEKVTKLLKGAVVGVAAGVFFLTALFFVLIGCAWLLYYFLPVNEWAYFFGFFAMAVILVVLGVIAGLIAAKVVKRSAPPVPTMAIAEAQKIKAAVSSPPAPGSTSSYSPPPAPGSASSYSPPPVPSSPPPYAADAPPVPASPPPVADPPPPAGPPVPAPSSPPAEESVPLAEAAPAPAPEPPAVAYEPAAPEAAGAPEAAPEATAPEPPAEPVTDEHPAAPRPEPSAGGGLAADAIFEKRREEGE